MARTGASKPPDVGSIPTIRAGNDANRGCYFSIGKRQKHVEVLSALKSVKRHLLYYFSFPIT